MLPGWAKSWQPVTWLRLDAGRGFLAGVESMAVLA